MLEQTLNPKHQKPLKTRTQSQNLYCSVYLTPTQFSGYSSRSSNSWKPLDTMHSSTTSFLKPLKKVPGTCRCTRGRGKGEVLNSVVSTWKCFFTLSHEPPPCHLQVKITLLVPCHAFSLCSMCLNPKLDQ
jgi:hypothetical protein